MFAYHQGSTFYPVINHLNRAIGLGDGDDARAKLEKIESFLGHREDVDQGIIASFARLLSVDPPESGDGLSADELKERIVATLLSHIESLASDQPVVIIFEDLHWIDPSSQELLDLLIDTLERTKLLLICTFRPDYNARWTGMARVTTLSLARLDGRNSNEMIEYLLAEQEISREFKEKISARAEGVPLFVEEMAKSVVERRKLDPTGIDPETELELPATLKELFQAKIDRLRDAREVVSVCAALDRNFSTAHVAAVHGLDDQATQRLLDQLVEANILTAHGGGSQHVYSFRHALIQEAAYEAMLSSRAQALHRRIAQAYIAKFPRVFRSNPEVVAQHFWRAEMPVEARDNWRQAATLAMSRSATQEAISHIEAAMRANERISEEDIRAQEEIELRKIYNVALHTREFGSESVRRNFETLHDLLSTSGAQDDDAFLSLHVRFGGYLMEGDPESALAICDEINAIAARSGSRPLAALAAHDLAMSRFMLGQFEEAISQFEKAIVLREGASPDQIFELHSADIGIVDMAMRAWALALGRADGPERRAELAHAVAAAHDEAHDFSRCFALNILAAAHQAVGDAEAALDLATAALEISRKRKFKYWDAWSGIIHGWARARAGDPAGGIGELRKGIEDYLATGSKQMAIYAHALLADANLAAGDIAEGLAPIAEIRRSRKTIHVRYQDSMARRIEAELLRARRPPG